VASAILNSTATGGPALPATRTNLFSNKNRRKSSTPKKSKTKHVDDDDDDDDGDGEEHQKISKLGTPAQIHVVSKEWVFESAAARNDLDEREFLVDLNEFLAGNEKWNFNGNSKSTGKSSTNSNNDQTQIKDFWDLSDVLEKDE